MQRPRVLYDFGCLKSMVTAGGVGAAPANIALIAETDMTTLNTLKMRIKVGGAKLVLVLAGVRPWSSR